MRVHEHYVGICTPYGRKARKSRLDTMHIVQLNVTIICLSPIISTYVPVSIAVLITCIEQLYHVDNMTITLSDWSQMLVYAMLQYKKFVQSL